jgi:hypothetical protein
MLLRRATLAFGFAVFVATVWFSTPGLAFGKCVSDRPVDYTDIDAVLYAVGYRTIDGDWKDADGYQPQRPADYQPTDMADSNFWTFWGLDRSYGEYSQFSLKGQIGDFNLSANLHDIVKLLRRDRFYELSSPLDEITDTSYSVLTVRRCSVVTRIMVQNIDISRADAQTRKLFSDLQNLIKNSKKEQTSAAPLPFALQGTFDK